MNFPEPLVILEAKSAPAEWPSVAVVIPCWNAEKWVARAIQSVLDQNYPNLEVIVIDDGSSDGSLHVIKSFGDKIRWETGPNRGACAARNKGFGQTAADYVLFVDADDYISGDYIVGLARAARESRPDLVVGRLAIDDNRGLQDEPHDHLCSELVIILRGLLDYKMIQTGQGLWARRFFVRIGQWDESLIRLQDFELAVRALAANPSMAFASDGRAIWFQHDTTNRVSAGTGLASLECSLVVFDKIAQLVGTLDDAECKRLLARYYYWLASKAFRCGHASIGAEALSAYRRLGGRGHLGRLTHKALSTIIGLRLKERVAHRLRRGISGTARAPKV